MEKNALVDLLMEPSRSFLTRSNDKMLAELGELEAAARGAADDDFKNEVWLYKKIVRAQSSFIRAFAHCKLEEYYSGWCEYEVAEKTLSDLQAVTTLNGDPFAIDFMARQTPRFQSLFPYSVFASMGLEVRARLCSICGATHGLKRGCEHRVGRLYSGKMCNNIIGDARVLEISMVESPVFKFAVPFSIDSRGNERDQYDYTGIGFLIDRLDSPFREWEVADTHRIEPHAKFPTERNEKCPCGSSKKYKKCCMNAQGIRFPHKMITFGEGLVPHLPATILPGRLKRCGRLFRRPDPSEPWATLAPAPVPPEPTTVKGDYRRQFVTNLARAIEN